MPRLSIHVRGVVQGVGFRPFVFRIAHARGVTGWVRNRPDGVEIEIQGHRAALDAFLASLEQERPAPSRIDGVEVSEIPDLAGEAAFEILASGTSADTR
ncbi:MAG TPA: acylphosphatase, partial [Holophaga sp.]|nr:acylphosphatase [Holophaga sp.]